MALVNSGDMKLGIRMPDERIWIKGGLPSALDTLNALKNHKYCICWTMYKLNNPEPTYLADRRYKCIFKCNEATGVCEGPSMKKAFYGALTYFLFILKQKYDWLMSDRNWTSEFKASLLRDSPVWKIIMSQMRARGIEVHHEIWESMDEVRNGKVYTCALRIDSKTYVGDSASSIESARLFAAEIAFKEVFQRPCPKVSMYLGKKARTPLNLYFTLNQDDVYQEIDDNQGDSSFD